MPPQICAVAVSFLSMSSNSRFREFAAWVGVELNSTSHAEKWVATSGALLGILVVALISLYSTAGVGAGLMVASMGASAVLLFVVPHGALSQPWPVVAGHLVAAAVGVCCRQWLPDAEWVPALAVALAIAAMQYLRCVHPPGGATALAAVMGGPEIAAMGFWFLLNPVLINVLSILAVALVFNNLFKWRLYPAHLMKKQHAETLPASSHYQQLTQEDFEAAIQQMNTFVDVTTDDLIELVDLATMHAEQQHSHPERIVVGHCYSNGQLGRLWSVREVLDQGTSTRQHRDKVIYKTLAGDGAWETGISGYEAFRQWARFEVVTQEGHWVRVQERDKAS